MGEGKEDEGRLLTWKGDGSGGDTVTGNDDRVVPTTGDEEDGGTRRTYGGATGAEELSVVELGHGLRSTVGITIGAEDSSEEELGTGFGRAWDITIGTEV